MSEAILCYAHLKVINPQAPAGLTDFDTSLEVAARSFDQKRYLYEDRKEKNEWFYTHLTREAIRSATKLDLRLASSPAS
jgi:hypothetical protein